MSDDAPRRVRVTADTGRPARSGAVRPAPGRPAAGRPGPARPQTRPLVLPDAAADEADAVYHRALRRTQLRLALGTVAGFVVVAVAMTVAIAGIPELDRIVLWGVPLSWLLHAFSFYPVIFVFALLYTRGAARNEQRYRALQERE